MNKNKCLNDLPDDILFGIFAFLDESSIMQAMDVCKRWDDLITAYTSLHASFTLDLALKHDESKLIDYNRFKKIKFQKFIANEIYEEGNIDKQAKKVLLQNKKNIKEASFYYGEWRFVENEVMAMTNLVKLSLEDMMFDHITRRITILSLKELTIGAHYAHVPNFLRTPNLVKLHYSGNRFPSKFLDKCLNFTHLKLMTYAALRAIPQQLTSMNIFIQHGRLIMPLLESQKESLKNLKMQNNVKDCDVEYAINNMKLEKLNTYMPKNLTLSKNESIKELVLKSYQQDFRAFVTILRSCSSTEKLILNVHSRIIEEATMYASWYLKNLKHLVIIEERKYEETFQVAIRPVRDFLKKFDTMESMLISLCSESNIDAHLRLIANCRKLKKLKIIVSRTTVSPIVSNLNVLQRILESAPDLDVFIIKDVFLLSEEVIELLQSSKIGILQITVKKDVFEEQQNLAIKLSKQSNIRCIVFKNSFQ